MTNDDQLYTPALERHALRETSLKTPWVSVPRLERVALGDWCYDILNSNFSSFYSEECGTDVLFIQTEGVAIARNLNVDLPPDCEFDYDAQMNRSVNPNPTQIIMDIAREDDDMLLNIADYLLASQLVVDNAKSRLRRLLSGSRSAWRVKEDGSGLTLRVSPEEDDLFHQVTIDDNLFSQQLKLSWDAAWRHNNPSASEAYDGAVKALEDILVPIVIPDDPKATLGKVISAMRDKPEKWSTRLQGAETVEALTAMLDELWKAHGRHARMKPNSLEQAQDAVTVAVAVVALVRRGFLTRVDDS